jgi:Flp pilus assembly pilin Flp
LTIHFAKETVMKMLRRLLQDEQGFVMSTELTVVATLLVVGLVTGLQCVQSAVVGEMKDVAAALGSLNQSYCFSGKHGCWFWHCGTTSWTAGSCFVDCLDELPAPVDIGCVCVSPYVELVPPLPPVVEPPCAVLPPLDLVVPPADCPPACPPVCDGPGTACVPADCPSAVPGPAPGGPEAAPVGPVVW